MNKLINFQNRRKNLPRILTISVKNIINNKHRWRKKSNEWQ